ncbi:hypothetical protein [Stakelama tenebrarum]|uniref:Uncharacterized protein n=1 Tax=Stakelama tenebrarum TaxID=2711215 RepID=A0A6G6Y5E6_9SPHN|nr:hypothetical protein [Sphingosinithalassobacter tenebrarum]QIG80071.1 hypothetical protein G5C33_09955 [Sphingosinithalassobacter tenebrarum]
MSLAPACYGKAAFDTHAQALRQMNRQRFRRRRGYGRVETYRCHICGYWHLGSNAL